MNLTGITIAITTFLIIGIFHPIVIKTEYHTGTRFWWVFLTVGIICCGIALFVENILLSAVLGVFGASCLWSVKELFEQKERVRKGWFPKKESDNDNDNEKNANENKPLAESNSRLLRRGQRAQRI